MSILGSFEVGKKAMVASQLGQSTTGHNLANVDTEGFSRQEIVQTSARPVVSGVGQGVDVNNVRRFQDGFTKEKIVGEQSNVGSWESREKILTETETIFTDLEGNKLKGALNEFWSAWGTLAHQPESPTMRKALLSKSQALAERFNMFYGRLQGMRDSLNHQVVADVKATNSITQRIAQLNKQVTQLENLNRPANDARDQRELLLQQLSEQIDIRYFENERGNLEVQLADGQALVHDRSNYELMALSDPNSDGDVMLSLKSHTGQRSDVTNIIKEGSIKEKINQRDGNILDYKNHIDTLAQELSFGVNRIHAGGTGIKGIHAESTSAHKLDKEALEQPLPMIESGFFQISLVDSQGIKDSTVTVYLDGGAETAESITTKINRAAGAYVTDAEGKETLKTENPLLAKLNEDGTLTLQGGMGSRFIFDGDNTNALAVLGFNNFFNGSGSAGTLTVNDELLKDEMKIAAGYGMIPSDNRIASDISDLQESLTMNGGTMSFDDYYNSQVTDVGLKVSDAIKGTKSHQEMLAQYTALRDSLSSVNVDEEMANMVKYQRAYEASAKYLSTIDEMTGTLIQM